MLQQRDGVGEVQAQIGEYLQLLEGRLAVESVVVTGSRAKNRHMRKSDVDLVVVSSHLAGMRRSDRIDLLLEDWYHTSLARHSNPPPLEALGFTPDEVMHANSLYLWDALADGHVILDSGPWATAREAFLQRCQQGDLSRTERGWRFR